MEHWGGAASVEADDDVVTASLIDTEGAWAAPWRRWGDGVTAGGFSEDGRVLFLPATGDSAQRRAHECAVPLDDLRQQTSYARTALDI